MPTKDKQPEFIFECKKCGFNIYVDKKIPSIRSLLVLDCDYCGEEPRWMLIGEGKYDNNKI